MLGHNVHALAVLAAGPVSDARYGVMMKSDDHSCRACGHEDGDWDHAAWSCPANPPPHPPPTDPLQRRMGWPVGDHRGKATDYDRKTLDHLATTRQTMLDRRYHGYDQHNDPEVYAYAPHDNDVYDDHDDRHDANEHIANENFYFHGGVHHDNNGPWAATASTRQRRELHTDKHNHVHTSTEQTTSLRHDTTPTVDHDALTATHDYCRRLGGDNSSRCP